jgi:hypothetical protein
VPGNILMILVRWKQISGLILILTCNGVEGSWFRNGGPKCFMGTGAPP